MTAPALTLPILAAGPAGAAPGASVAAGGGAEGFEALLAALFGTGEATPDGLLLGDGAKADGKTDADADGDAATTDSAPVLPVDAQTLAALMAAQPQAATPGQIQPEGEVKDGASEAATAPAFAPTAPQQQTADLPVATPAAALAGQDAAAEAAPDLSAALPQAGEDAGRPAAGALPETPAVDTPKAAAPETPAQQTPAKPAAAAPQAHAPATAQAQAQAPVEAAEAAPAPLVQAQAAATTEVAPDAEPTPTAAPKPGKSDTTKRASATTAAPSPAAGQADAAPQAQVAAAPHAEAKAAPAADTASNTDLFAAAAAKDAGAEATADTPDAPAPGPAAATTAQAAAPAAEAPQPVRGSPETVAHLSAQIVKKLEGRSTHFDVELTPAGLGQVNVKVEIGAHGKMTASMSFDTPQAAAEVRARAGELQKALEQSGFDLSGGSISFDVAGDRGGQGRGDLQQQWQQQQEQHENAWRGRAFQAVLDTAGEAAQSAATAALAYQRRSSTGVDVRV